jgi:hypothetical protein
MGNSMMDIKIPLAHPVRYGIAAGFGFQSTRPHEARLGARGGDTLVMGISVTLAPANRSLLQRLSIGFPDFNPRARMRRD